MKTSVTSRRILRIGVTIVLVVALVGGGIAVFLAGHSHTTQQREKGRRRPHPGQGVRPHYDKTLTMTEKRPADVLAYYRDDLDSHVAGVISKIEVDKGYEVAKDYPLDRDICAGVGRQS